MNERLKKLRKELDMTQQEFADSIGIKEVLWLLMNLEEMNL